MRDLICKCCLQKVGEEETVRATKPKKVKLCDWCKQISLLKHRENLIVRNKSDEMKEKNSERMSNSNPMFDEQTRIKVSETMKEGYKSGYFISSFSDPKKLNVIKSSWKITDGGRRAISERMRDKNPMRNAESKAKMVATFKTKIESGEIVYKKGIEHHLWKGNRGFCDTLRVQLYPVWIKKCLERDGFKCTECDSITNLTVHHLKPLREFVSETLQKHGIDNFSDISAIEWQQYFDEIISNHKLEDGKTLCKKCHSEIDEFYNYKESK